MVSNKDLLYNSCEKLHSEEYGSGREQCMQFLLMYAIFVQQKKTQFFTLMCQREHIQFFCVRFEMCLKEKSFNCARFSIVLFGLDGKQQQMKALTLFFCMQTSLCVNVD